MSKSHRGEEAPPKEDAVYGGSLELEAGSEEEFTNTSGPQQGA